MSTPALSHVSGGLSILRGGVRPPDRTPEPISSVLRGVAETSLHGVHFLSVSHGEQIKSYKRMYDEAQKIAFGLASSGLKQGDKVILQSQRPAEILSSLWACLVGGFVVVPMGVPLEYDGTNLQSRWLQYAYRFLDSPAILASGEYLKPLSDMFRKNGANRTLRVFDGDEILNRSNDRNYCESSLDDTAAILLTSGSTGDPKFVPISHLNFFTSISGSALAQGLGAQDVSLNWLPFHHVSVLMRSVRDVYGGCTQIQGQAADVLAEPLRWIDWIHQHKVTTTWAPNFAFALVAQCMAKTKGHDWDLGSLRSIAAAGEPVQLQTIESFAELLKPFGLRRSALNVSWGMTEACFASYSLDALGSMHRGSIMPVGQPIPGVSIRVADDRDHVVLNGVAGHVQISGELVTKGYFNNPDLNNGSFTGDGWLRTGDLGMIQRGSLSITGRLKDLIVIHGAKYSIKAVESFAEQLDGIVPMSVAVCIIQKEDSGTEDFVLFFEPVSQHEEDWPSLISRVKIEIHQKMGIAPFQVIPLDRSSLPRSAGGKILRAELTKQFVRGDFQPIIQKIEARTFHPETQKRIFRNSAEDSIAACFCVVLKRSSVHSSDNFFELGGNSIQAIQLAAHLSKLFPHKKISPIDLLAHPTVQQLAQYVQSGGVEQVALKAAVERGEFRKRLLAQQHQRKEQQNL